ncbi:MAG: RNA polymerase sigma factor [Pseudomonadota bacterium]
MTENEQAEQIRQVLQRAMVRICPDWLQSSRDDLVQNAMLKILEMHKLTEGNPPVQSSYLYKTAHSVMIDEIRRVRRRDESALDDSQAVEDANQAGPYRTTLGHKISVALRECLGRMVELRRMGVILHLQGHTVPDIARLLGWKTKQADNNVYRGMANLRNCMQEKGFEST